MILALIATSESFEKCIHERKNHEAYKALHEERPLFVEAIVRLKLHAACARVTAGENDGAIVALLTLALAAFTYRLWKSTDNLWLSAENQLTEFRRSLDHAENVAKRQSADMLASITEAARAAAAMEGVAVSTARNTEIVGDMAKSQMRAYISVNVGAFYDQVDGVAFLQIHPLVINTGHTPAHELTFRGKIVVRPFPPGPNFDFSLPEEDEERSVITVGPNQNITMPLSAQRWFSKGEIDEFKAAIIKRVYVYGTVNYKDAFRCGHYTNFCYSTTWSVTGNPTGSWTRRHNDSD